MNGRTPTHRAGNAQAALFVILGWAWINLLRRSTPQELIAGLERRFRVGGDGVAESESQTSAALYDFFVLGLSTSPLPATVRDPAVLDALEAMSEVGWVDRIREDEGL